MKQKTKKAAQKRFQFNASGQASRRPVHQAHFNARDNGEATRRKHTKLSVSPSDQSRVTDLLPYK